MEGYHKSVLLKEAIEALNVKKGAWFMDCTLGDGGHSLEILRQGGKVVGIDVDPQALKRAKKRLGDVVLIQGNFRDIDNLLSAPIKSGKQTELRDQKFAGAIFDLGISSLQLESPERGFSFARSGPLDMRMDPALSVLALDLVNNLSGKELYEIFKKLGEEKYSKLVARALVRARQVKPFETTTELAELVVRVLGGVREKIHPATRVFQALRIVVNDELGALEEGLVKVKEKIQKNGRIVVISFHSLEDKIVKNTFRDWELAGEGEVLTKKPVVPDEGEIVRNPRARSAKMRVFKKNDNNQKI